MRLTPWLSMFGSIAKRQNKARRARPVAIDRLEMLEDRALLSGFNAGSIQGQDGWTGGNIDISPMVDQQVDQSGTNAHSGSGSWQISNSTVDGNYIGYFNGMPFSPALSASAGHSGSGADGDQFNATFWFKAASVSSLGDGSNTEIDLGTPSGDDRNNAFYITNYADADGGLTLRINSPDGAGNFLGSLNIAAGISRTEWHRIDIVAKFNVGGANDTFQILLDGVVQDDVNGRTEFPTFESYRDANSFGYPLTNRLLFRNGSFGSSFGAFTTTDPQGFFIDDLHYSVSNQSSPGVALASYTAAFEFETSTTYVDDSWAGLNFNDPIVDADLSTPGNQPATFGLDAFSTIQGGVNAVAAGGTTIVNAGTYAEKVSVNKSVRILGAQDGVDAQTGRVGAQESIVTGAAGSTSFYITSDNVVVDGFTIQGATNANNFGAAVFMGPGTAGTQILNNIVQNNLIGIFASNDSAALQTLIQQNLFRNNTVPGPGSGTDIYLDQYTAGVGAQNIKIDNNTFTNSTFQEDSWGIGVSNTNATPISDLIITNNTITNHGRGMYFFSTDGATITGNTITGATRYGIGIFDSGVAGTESSGFVIDNNTITTSGTGIGVSIDNSGYTGPLVVTDSGVVDVFGTNGNDAVTLSVVGGKLQYTLGGNTFDITGATGFNFDGGDGSDTFTIDFSGAPGLFNLPITFNGGDGPGIDTLTTFGGTFNNGQLIATGDDSGTLQYSGGVGLITFDGLEPIIDDNTVTNYRIDATGSADVITIADGAASRTVVSEATPNFEQVAFKNKTNVTIRGLGGKDTFVLNNPNPATGLSSLTIIGGGAVDTVQVTGNFSLPGAIDFTVENVELSANLGGTITGDATSVKVLTNAAEIQDGVDAAAATGATVIISAGTYTGNVSTSAKSVTLAPDGTSVVGITGDLTLDANDTLQMQITGAGTFDSFTVSGTVTLGGATLTPTISYPAPIGQEFIIVNNTGALPVSGIFAGLVEGAIIVIGTDRLAISYVGGDGNDVTLTKAAPAVSVALSASGNLTVTGTSNDDKFTIEVVGPNQVRLIGLNGTNFTGAGGNNVTTTVLLVTGTVTVNTLNGNDEVHLAGSGGTAQLSGKVSIDLGMGDDLLNQTGGSPLRLNGGLSVIGGAGSETVTLGLGASATDLTTGTIVIDTGADSVGVPQSITFVGVTANGNVNLTNSGTAAQSITLGPVANAINGNLTIIQSNAANTGGYTVTADNAPVSGYVLITHGNTTGSTLVDWATSNVGGLFNVTNGNATVSNSVLFTSNTVGGNSTVNNGTAGANSITVTGGAFNGMSASFTNGTAVTNSIDLGLNGSTTFTKALAATNNSASGTNTINVHQASVGNGATLSNKANGTAVNIIAVGNQNNVNVTGNLAITNGNTTASNSVTVNRLATSGSSLGDVSIANGTAATTTVTFGSLGLSTIGGNLSIRNQATTGVRTTNLGGVTVNGASGIYLSNAGAGNSATTVGASNPVIAAGGLKIEDGTGNATLDVRGVTLGSFNFTDLGGGTSIIDIGGAGGGAAVISGSTRIVAGSANDTVRIGTAGTAALGGFVGITLAAGDDTLIIGNGAAGSASLSGLNYQFDGGLGTDSFVGSTSALPGYVAPFPGPTLKSKITNFEIFSTFQVPS